MSEERRQDGEKRDRVSAMQGEYRALAERNWNRINETYAAWRRSNRWVRWLLALLAVVQIATGITVGLLEADSSRTAGRAQQLAVAIQQERHDNLLQACQDSNRRHDKTLGRLQTVVADAEKRQPARKAEIDASVSGTILLIDALAPKTANCEARADAAVRKK
jgi:hypothetical protein